MLNAYRQFFVLLCLCCFSGGWHARADDHVGGWGYAHHTGANMCVLSQKSGDTNYIFYESPDAERVFFRVDDGKAHDYSPLIFIQGDTELVFNALKVGPGAGKEKAGVHYPIDLVTFSKMIVAANRHDDAVFVAGDNVISFHIGGQINEVTDFVRCLRGDYSVSEGAGDDAGAVVAQTASYSAALIDESDERHHQAYPDDDLYNGLVRKLNILERENSMLRAKAVGCMPEESMNAFGIQVLPASEKVVRDLERKLQEAEGAKYKLEADVAALMHKVKALSVRLDDAGFSPDDIAGDDFSERSGDMR